MSFDNHQVNTGSRRYEMRAFGIGEDVVGVVDKGMWGSGASLPSSESGR